MKWRKSLQKLFALRSKSLNNFFARLLCRIVCSHGLECSRFVDSFLLILFNIFWSFRAFLRSVFIACAKVEQRISIVRWRKWIGSNVINISKLMNLWGIFSEFKIVCKLINSLMRHNQSLQSCWKLNANHSPIHFHALKIFTFKHS